MHNQLGTIYRDGGDLDRAVQYYRESIRLKEQAGNHYAAALSRFNVALVFLDVGRREDALEYAEAALRGFEPYGAGAAEVIERSRRLITRIRG
jgi:tetratricopeptide (TPR) repeat protein